ncbi:hypothetical protein [Nitrosovibrio sp. Nv6]|uniref:hypothetical protein n=1 Tax=Nitrosovibrio sp. Nv6 TaxID=1855340 RepID=UPI0008BEC183|nr:hypothetical protein [Nitrosovibrio sp. Nv6]SEO77295.1 hypothetical protein SAMN05216316_1052 [Nitrosovibrio sp. Nv6]
MTMYQRKKLKEYADKFNEMNTEAENGADSLLDKLKASKWTAAILGGAGAIIIVAIMLKIVF